MLEHVSRIVMLKDFYGPLLTEKQQHILALYYENDLSFSEIAEEMQISRQAVYDLVRRAEGLLENYESKLGLVEKFQASRQTVQEIGQLLQTMEETPEVHKMMNMLRELTILL